MKFKYLLAIGILVGTATSCSNLTEELQDDLTANTAEQILTESADVTALLTSAYQGLRLPYQDQTQMWAAQEHTSDEVIGPTRGPDWDDNGIWRVLHDHSWDPDHSFLGGTFDALLQVVFNTTNILSFNPSASQGAEARFLRAFVVFALADGWGQVPFREPGENLLNPPAVLSGTDAIDFVISECQAIMADLPDGPTYVANKDAARVLLMKSYLNKGVYTNRANPTFAAGDMDMVVQYADEIINSGSYSIQSGFDGYFANFAPDNDQISTENIFTAENIGGQTSGNVRSRWFCTLHYNQNPSGWNGFTTISDFYNKFDADNDVRVGGPYAGITDVAGINAGFLVGQQFDQDGNALEDRKGNPLAFTPEVALKESGDNLEVTGIRVVKYPIDYNNGDNVDNDYVFYRYADVLLMKAEAMMRNGNTADALTIVNEIRTARGVAALANLDADAMIDERGRELYWEGHRRTDLIRFGKFLNAWNEKPASSETYLLFPIPSEPLAVNPNLVQNPGY